jgi:hypothetical protein
MTGTIRLFPHGAGHATTRNGRYTNTPGNYIDEPAGDLELNLLLANGWLKIGPAGPTSGRPTDPVTLSNAPILYVDTTLGKTVVWDGAAWRDPATGATA